MVKRNDDELWIAIKQLLDYTFDDPLFLRIDEIIKFVKQREHDAEVRGRKQAFEDVWATDIEGTLNRLVNARNYIYTERKGLQSKGENDGR